MRAIALDYREWKATKNPERATRILTQGSHLGNRNGEITREWKFTTSRKVQMLGIT